jgi:hypothetical protein
MLKEACMNRMIMLALLLMFAAASATRVASRGSQASKNDNSAKAGAAQKDSVPQDTGSHAPDSTPKAGPTQIKVVVLSTEYNPDPVVHKYPKSVLLAVPPGLVGQIAAYGASSKVWIGPKGWTGSGVVGVDGNVVVKLYPTKKHIKSGPHISYYQVPACEYCMLHSAARFFSNARLRYNSEQNENGKDPVTIPKGLKRTRLSSTLVTYTLPDSNGLSTRGVAYYNQDDRDCPYTNVEFTLPAEESDLSDFLLRTLIRREHLK